MSGMSLYILPALLLLALQRGACFASTNSPVRGQVGTNAIASDFSIPVSNAKSNLRAVSIAERITFSWVKELIAVGNKGRLEIKDLWALPPADLVHESSNRLENYLALETNSTSDNDTADVQQGSVFKEFWASPLTRAVVAMNIKTFRYTALLRLLCTVVQFTPSIIIARILRLIEMKKLVGAAARKEGVLLSVALLTALCIKTFLENQFFDSIMNMGSIIKGALSAAIYRKSLRLSPASRQNNTVGDIVNYMQLDTTRLEYVASSIHSVWDGLLQIFGFSSLLLYFLGPSVFAGIFVLVVVLPLNKYFLDGLSKQRMEMAKFTDKRVRLTNEVLVGSRAIKSYNWEKPFEKMLSSIREFEIASLQKSSNLRGILVALLSTSPSFVAMFTLGAYGFLGNTLSPTRVFTALALFNQLRSPILLLPNVLNALSDGKISLRRLTKFFLAEEVKDYVEQLDKEASEEAVLIKDEATFAWSEVAAASSSSRGCLRNVDLTIKKGELVAVVGPIGSGKSVLLSALLGDLHKTSGRVGIRGSVAYVPQSPWIPSGTVRDVIRFGRPYEEFKYAQTIKACRLSDDLAMLDAGDSTEIGERGTNLSGGQKQRISIARAVYEDADVYIFDDPLSALDADVSSKVFSECIKDGPLKDKTRILVTHQLKVLPQVDRIIIMGQSTSSTDGACGILDQGTFQELLSRGHDLDSLVRDDRRDASLANTAAASAAAASAASIPSPADPAASIPAVVQAAAKPAAASAVAAASASTKAEPSKMVAVEERAVGAVQWSSYSAYLKSAKAPLLLTTAMVSLVLANLFQISQQWVISAWCSDTGYKKHSLTLYFAAVSATAIANAVFSWARVFFIHLGGAAASRNIHEKMVKSVLSAPLSYFETTPVGRLVQRFSKDLDQIDQLLPSAMGQLCTSTGNIVYALAAVSLASPHFTIAMIPIFFVYMRLTNYYRNVARELKRLEAISRSPIYSQFGETLSGLQIIRSFKRESMFKKSNEAKLDDNVSANFALKAVDRWVCVRLELLGNSVVFVSALLSLFIPGNGAGKAGIALNNALLITTLLNWAVRQAADSEALMNSVERVFYTADNTPREAAAFKESISPSALVPVVPANVESKTVLPVMSDSDLVQSGWPWKGGIEFSGASMRYREDLDLVLRNINIQIIPGERIGIVGRTGSGKSSIFRALLRLTELGSGTTQIDGVNISEVGLDALRSVVTIIPQESVFFSGTVRMNLDPFQTVCDEAVWSALEQANAADIVRSLPGQLSFELVEGGDNLSGGQKQLLCLARALIRKSKILLLDEATSSVDYETDALVQKTIRRVFGDGKATVLTVAHRLDSILDSDRVLVMDAGSVAEFDKPSVLAKNPYSLFAKLLEADKTGGAAAAKDIAYTG